MFDFHQRPLNREGMENWDNIFKGDTRAEEVREMRREGSEEDQTEGGVGNAQQKDKEA